MPGEVGAGEGGGACTGPGDAFAGRGRVPVAILGASGIVGQRLVRMLEGHPRFRLAEVVGSERRAGRRYGDVVPWSIGGDPPSGAARLVLRGPGALAGDGGVPLRSPVVLSALPSGVAAAAEIALARAGHVVCTNAAPHRLRGDTPLIVPEVNPGAIAGVAAQPWREGGGALVANPNCVVAGLALACAPLSRAFGIEAATVVTLQAVSGAGLGGLGAVEVAGNVIPGIAGEEEKIGPELNKVLSAEIEVAVAVNRVPVLDGHTAHVFLRLGSRASSGDALRALRGFRPPAAARALPTLPARPLALRTEPDRPQPRLDADAAAGMAVSVGRVRAAPPPHDLAFVVVAHNGVRGAAGACLGNAELYAARYGRGGAASSDAARRPGAAAAATATPGRAAPAAAARSGPRTHPG